jgi:hypothetical protein
VVLDNVPAATSAEFALSLEERHLEFGMDEGEVRDLCASPEDPLWVLNIKRGILSTFQQRISSLSSRLAAPRVHSFL